MEDKNFRHGIAIREKGSDKLIKFVECPTGKIALKTLMGIRHNLNHDDYKAEQTILSANTILKLITDKLNKPKVICICGSTRFTDLMLVKQWELTKQGCIVLSWCALPDWYFKGEDKTHIGDKEGVKKIVDKVHFQKIDISDEIFVINKDGYIGESTRNEINYAKKLGRPIEYLEK